MLHLRFDDDNNQHVCESHDKEILRQVIIVAKEEKETKESVSTKIETSLPEPTIDK